ncbi:MAG: HIG1 domain-containing protein [Acidiferrobacteraceae bacterium]
MAIILLLVAFGTLMTLGVLVSGIFSMAHGGIFDDKHSGQMMALRVGLQGLVILLVLVGTFIAHR